MEIGGYFTLIMLAYEFFQITDENTFHIPALDRILEISRQGIIQPFGDRRYRHFKSGSFTYSCQIIITEPVESQENFPVDPHTGFTGDSRIDQRTEFVCCLYQYLGVHLFFPHRISNFLQVVIEKLIGRSGSFLVGAGTKKYFLQVIYRENSPPTQPLKSRPQPEVMIGIV